MIKFLKSLPRNPRNVILTEPMWSIFGGLIFYYVPLYMKENGLDEVQMGLVNTVGLAFAFIFYLFASTITNRLGRKRTTLIFDIISWTIPMLLWAFATNLWFFLVAAAINSSVRIVHISWFCLLTEDTPVDKRAKIYGLLSVFTNLTGVITPVTAIFIGRFGLSPTMRVIYLLGVVSMTSMFFLRNAIIDETAVGKELMKQHGEIPLSHSIKGFLVILYGLRNQKDRLLITLINILFTFILSISFFQIVFLKEYLSFSTSSVSYMPALSALVSIIIFAFIFPLLKNKNEIKILAFSFIPTIIGSIVFIFIPSGNLVVLMAVTAVLSSGLIIIAAFKDSVLMNLAGEHDKADFFSAVQTLTTLVCIPAGYIGGKLYSIDPRYPFFLVVGLLFLSFIAALILGRTKRVST